MALAQQVHTEFAFMGVAAIQRSLPDSSGHGDLMHADGIDALLGEEAPGDLQDAPAMLRCIASFRSRTRYEWPGQAGRPRAITSFFLHCSPLLTTGQLSVTIPLVDNCPQRVYHIVA